MCFFPSVFFFLEEGREGNNGCVEFVSRALTVHEAHLLIQHLALSVHNLLHSLFGLRDATGRGRVAGGGGQGRASVWLHVVFVSFVSSQRGACCVRERTTAR